VNCEYKTCVLTDTPYYMPSSVNMASTTQAETVQSITYNYGFTNNICPKYADIEYVNK